MINRWERGRAEIDQLIRQGRLTRVSANRGLAESHLTQAATQYPDIDRPSASADDVNQAIPAAKAIVDRASRIVESVPQY